MTAGPGTQGASSIPVRFAVEIQVDNARIIGIARNLSRTGMVLVVPAADDLDVAQDKPVDVFFTLPGMAEVVAFTALIPWKQYDQRDHRGNEAVALGVQFLDTSALVQRMLRTTIAQYQPSVLMVGFDGATVQACSELLLDDFRVLSANKLELALRYLDRVETAVLCLGPGLKAVQAAALVKNARHAYPGNATVNVVLGGGPDLSPFTELMAQDAIFYLAGGEMVAPDVTPIVQSAAARYRSLAVAQRQKDSDGLQAIHLQRILELSQRLSMQDDLQSVSQLVVEALEQLTDADRAYCMVHDADRQVVWTQDLDSPHMREASATSGLISFVARTGVSVAVEQAGADARYDRAVDDPPGRGDERLLAEPVLAGRAAGGPGQVMAILVAVRDASRAPFTREERETMATLAGRVGADLARLDLKNQLEELSSHNEELLRQKPLQIFREEALDHYAHRRAVEGDVLRISPRWIGWTYWLLLLIAAAGLVFAVFGRVTETALGPAIVKVEGQTLITATTPGTVTRIAVRPGDSVTKGQVLVRFHDRQERAAVKRVQREYDLQLSKLLRNPGDSAAQQAVMGLRIQRQRAQASLDQRTVRAPAAGMVRDVRVPVGQHVMPGNILLTLAGDETRYKVVAMLPGHYRPLLFKRMTMRFELTGYRYTFQKVPINIISDGVISPAEAHRYLGKGPAEAVSLVGSVVMVEASLPSPTFSFQGQKHHFYDGMYGRSMVPVRSESILVSLLPSLKRIWGGVK